MSQKMEQLRVAIIGLGHGKSHLAAVRDRADARVVALVDPNIAQIGPVADLPGVERFTSVDELVRSGVADAAVIAVPTQAHADVAEACLDGGLHVLLEKPLCATDEDARRIARAVERNARVLQIGYEVRSSPLHQTIMQHLAQGDLGEVTNVWWHQHTCQNKPAYGGWRQSRANMGGALFDCAPHFLDLISQWAGAPLVRVMAMGNLRGQTGPCPKDVLPESAVITLEYANGVRGTYNFGAVNEFRDDATFGVAGTTGCIRGNPIFAGEYELRTDCGRSVRQVRFDPAKTSAGHLGFREQWSAFVAPIRDGAPNVCSIADGLAIHWMMRAIDESLTTGLPARLDRASGVVDLLAHRVPG